MRTKKHILVRIKASKNLPIHFFGIKDDSTKMQEEPKKCATEQHTGQLKFIEKKKEKYFWAFSLYRNKFPPAFFFHVPWFYRFDIVK